jgi:hypothetical protein
MNGAQRVGDKRRWKMEKCSLMKLKNRYWWFFVRWTKISNENHFEVKFSNLKFFNKNFQYFLCFSNEIHSQRKNNKNHKLMILFWTFEHLHCLLPCVLLFRATLEYTSRVWFQVVFFPHRSARIRFINNRCCFVYWASQLKMLSTQ